MKIFLFYVYILTSQNNRVIYIGVTNNLKLRAEQHKKHQIPGFTAQYNVDKLVYFETFDFIEDAIYREKQLKKWHRDWKNNLIKTRNPNWNDLTPTL